MSCLWEIGGSAEAVDHLQEGGLPALLQGPPRPPVARQRRQPLQEQDRLLRKSITLVNHTLLHACNRSMHRQRLCFH